MKSTIKRESGFTAVEAIITLFIGALFVIAGNQLFSNVMSAGDKSGDEAEASTIAYSYLKSRSPSANSPCVADPGTTYTADTDNPILEQSKLTNLEVIVSVSCPYQDEGDPLQNISKITATTTYGSGDEAGEVSHGTLAKP